MTASGPLQLGDRVRLLDGRDATLIGWVVELHWTFGRRDVEVWAVVDIDGNLNSTTIRLEQITEPVEDVTT
jgi:hypothetical protein